MDWQERLIGLYLYICDHYETHLWVHAQRLSNNDDPKFSDEEVLTLYLFGIMQKYTTIKAIYAYTQDHLHDWFPTLPTYEGYVQRLNHLAATFSPLVEQIVADCPSCECFWHSHLVDSFPCVMANAKRSGKACVAAHLANKGFCASKGMWYYGVKLHIVAKRSVKGLPKPDYISLTGAADHDLSALRPLLPYLHNGQLYGDKIYSDQTLKDTLYAKQNLAFYTPVKKRRGKTSCQRPIKSCLGRLVEYGSRLNPCFIGLMKKPASQWHLRCDPITAYSFMSLAVWPPLASYSLLTLNSR